MATVRTVALAAVFVIVSAASGSAQDDQDPFAPVDSDQNDFARNGFYVGLAVNLGINTFKDVPEEDINDELAALGIIDIGLRIRDEEPQDNDIFRTVPVVFSDVQANMDMGLSIGVSGRIGYRFHPNVSAELQAEWQDGFDANVGTLDLVRKFPALNIPYSPPAPPPGGTPARDAELAYPKFATFEVKPWVITGNVKGYLLTGRWQPFLLAGVGLMTAKVELEVQDSVGEDPVGEAPLGSEFRQSISESDRFTGFAARFGGGIDIYATKEVVVTLGIDYVFPTGDVKDLDYVSVGWGFQYRF